MNSSLSSRWFITGLFLWLAMGIFGVLQASSSGEEKALPEVSFEGLMTVENEFVRLLVNVDTLDAGRYSLETTGGDPARPDDDKQILLYGHPPMQMTRPWTSYTTVRVDDVNYAFGGETKRRAGASTRFGFLSQPPTRQEDGSILTTTTFGDIQVTQRLSLARSPTTRMLDSLQIEYRVVNSGIQPHTVGLRIMLDTMLGTNDGAPLRAGAESITAEKCFSGDAVPDFFQAFDSLSEPHVIAQGTLRGEGLTPPSALYIANWGTLADEPWEMECREGESLIRKGEEEVDSAVALYYSPRTLSSGESFTIRTLYGLGGITTTPGKLLLGITAPMEVAFKPRGTPPFTVVGYLENTGGFLSRNTALHLRLPPGLSLLRGETDIPVGDFSGGQAFQYAWQVVPDGKAFGLQDFQLNATSESYEENTARRGIFIHPPPTLNLVITAPEQLSVKDTTLENNPFVVKATLTNPESIPVNHLLLSISLPEGLSLPPPEKPQKFLSELEPGELAEFSWKVKALEGLSEVEYSVTAESEDIFPATGRKSIFIPSIYPRLALSPASITCPVGEYFYLDLLIEKVSSLSSGQFTLTYDPYQIRLVMVRPGTLSLRNGFKMTSLHREPGKLSFSFLISPDTPLDTWETLIRLYARALQPGSTKFSLNSWELKQGDTLLDLPFRNASITIFK